MAKANENQPSEQGKPSATAGSQSNQPSEQGKPSAPQSKAEKAKAALRERVEGGAQNVSLRPSELAALYPELKKSPIKEVAEKAKQLEKMPQGTAVVVRAEWLALAIS